MNYKSIFDLNKDITKWLYSLPNDIDVVVGVPRSGLLAANILALHKNLPLTDIEGLLNDKLISGGYRLNQSNNFLNKKYPLNILILDDSINSGRQLMNIKSKINESKTIHNYRYGAVYATNNSKKFVDYWYEIVNQPRVFEWNIMHHDYFLNRSCVDIDGILCPDPTEKQNDDGKNYIKFISETKPRFIPSYEIGWLVTCRLEKYREYTEAWLNKYNITYKNLIMMDLPDMQTRRKFANHGKFKANFYAKTNALLFIESSHDQAIEIARLSGKSVYCFETNEMINPNKIDSLISRIFK